MKCKWSHCRYDNLITENQEYVKDKNSYYHKDCLREKNSINEVIVLFTENVNNKVTFSVLRSVISHLIYKEGYDTEYILYCIRYCIDHPEVKLTYPQGLYRVCRSEDFISRYKKKMAKNIFKDKKIEINDTIPDPGIQYNITKKKSCVSDLL